MIPINGKVVRMLVILVGVNSLLLNNLALCRLCSKLEKYVEKRIYLSGLVFLSGVKLSLSRPLPPPPQKSKIPGYLSNKHIQCFCMGVSPLGVGTWCNWGGGGEYSRGGEFYKIPVQVFLEFSLFLENYH